MLSDPAASMVDIINDLALFRVWMLQWTLGSLGLRGGPGLVRPEPAGPDDGGGSHRKSLPPVQERSDLRE